ncbi:hypothetical protein FRC01_010304 [Tulasnella sp. 417]|nr:hypothetical protein FRC01_010304 [Tulasnella sp. 417]
MRNQNQENSTLEPDTGARPTRAAKSKGRAQVVPENPPSKPAKTLSVPAAQPAQRVRPQAARSPDANAEVMDEDPTANPSLKKAKAPTVSAAKRTSKAAASARSQQVHLQPTEHQDADAEVLYEDPHANPALKKAKAPTTSTAKHAPKAAEAITPQQARLPPTEHQSDANAEVMGEDTAANRSLKKAKVGTASAAKPAPKAPAPVKPQQVHPQPAESQDTDPNAMEEDPPTNRSSKTVNAVTVSAAKRTPKTAPVKSQKAQSINANKAGTSLAVPNELNAMDVDQAPLRKHKSATMSAVDSEAIQASPDSTSDSADGPQPKKSKKTSVPAKPPGTGKAPRTVTTASSRSSSTLKPLAVAPKELASSADKSAPGACKEVATSSAKSTAAKKKDKALQKTALAAAQNALLLKEMADLKALLAEKEAENLRLQQTAIKAQQDFDAKNRLIPRPPGERGKDGWNLQKHMGLENDDETYGKIRRCVRYAVYESQLNIWKKITDQDEKSLFTCYAVIKKRWPFMEQFEGNWATREFVKGICQNARRHCRNKGLDDPTLPAQLLEGDDEGSDKRKRRKTSKSGKASTSTKSKSKGKGKAKAKNPAHAESDGSGNDRAANGEGSDDEPEEIVDTRNSQVKDGGDNSSPVDEEAAVEDDNAGKEDVDGNGDGDSDDGDNGDDNDGRDRNCDLNSDDGNDNDDDDGGNSNCNDDGDSDGHCDGNDDGDGNGNGNGNGNDDSEDVEERDDEQDQTVEEEEELIMRSDEEEDLENSNDEDED